MPNRVPRTWWSTMSMQLRQQLRRACVSVVRRVDVAVQGVEEPQRRIGRVIEPFVFAFREHVRDQAVANVVGERAQDVARLVHAAGRSVSPSRLIIVSRPQSVNQ